MTRIVDLPGALGRPGVESIGCRSTVDLEVADDLLAANQGRWRVEIADGTASAEPGGNGSVRLDINTLASWYVGHAAPTALAREGRIESDDPRCISTGWPLPSWEVSHRPASSSSDASLLLMRLLSEVAFHAFLSYFRLHGPLPEATRPRS